MTDGCISANSDLVGIGTRVNFYVTILLLAIIPEAASTTELVRVLYENSVYYGPRLHGGHPDGAGTNGPVSCTVRDADYILSQLGLFIRYEKIQADV